eukprot:3622502-Pyramimonas_sp.AAC.1
MFEREQQEADSVKQEAADYRQLARDLDKEGYTVGDDSLDGLDDDAAAEGIQLVRHLANCPSAREKGTPVGAQGPALGSWEVQPPAACE